MIVVGTRDVCCALEVVARGTAAGVHNLYVPGTITMREVLTLLAEIRGRRPHFLSVPSGLLLPVLATAERLGFRMPVTSENLRGYRVSQTGIGNTHLPELVRTIVRCARRYGSPSRRRTVSRAWGGNDC